MNFSIKKLGFAAPLLAVAGLLTAHPVQGQKAYTVNTGVTYVKLSSTLLTALGDLKVTPGFVAPTQLNGTVVNFPVTGGVLDAQTAAGQILHSGGLTFTAGKTKVKLESFIIDTTGQTPVISGIVVANGQVVGRITLFDLALPSTLKLPISPNNGVIQLENVGVTLDATAASALNSAFGVSAFTAGLSIGTGDLVALVPLNIDGD